jgi:hypothetical protein
MLKPKVKRINTGLRKRRKSGASKTQINNRRRRSYYWMKLPSEAWFFCAEWR